MQLAHCDRADAEAEPRPFRHRVLAGAIRDALHALDLVEQVGEFGARALEGRRIDVRDVVRDHLDVELLRAHAGRGDGQGSHCKTSDRHPADFLVGLHDLVADRDRHLQRLLGRHDRFDHLWAETLPWMPEIDAASPVFIVLIASLATCCSTPSKPTGD